MWAVQPCGEPPASLTPEALSGPEAIRGNRKRLKRRTRAWGAPRPHPPGHSRLHDNRECSRTARVRSTSGQKACKESLTFSVQLEQDWKFSGSHLGPETQGGEVALPAPSTTGVCALVFFYPQENCCFPGSFN